MSTNIWVRVASAPSTKQSSRRKATVDPSREPGMPDEMDAPHMKRKTRSKAPSSSAASSDRQPAARDPDSDDSDDLPLERLRLRLSTLL